MRAETSVEVRAALCLPAKDVARAVEIATPRPRCDTGTWGTLRFSYFLGRFGVIFSRWLVCAADYQKSQVIRLF